MFQGVHMFNTGLTVCLTMDRYFTVVHPFFAKRWCTPRVSGICTLIAGVVGVIVGFIKYFDFTYEMDCIATANYSLIDVGDANQSLTDSNVSDFIGNFSAPSGPTLAAATRRTYRLLLTNQYLNPNYRYIFTVITVPTIRFFVPLFIVLFFNIKLVVVLFYRRQILRRSSKEQNQVQGRIAAFKNSMANFRPHRLSATHEEVEETEAAVDAPPLTNNSKPQEEEVEEALKAKLQRLSSRLSTKSLKGLFQRESVKSNDSVFSAEENGVIKAALGQKKSLGGDSGISLHSGGISDRPSIDGGRNSFDTVGGCSLDAGSTHVFSVNGGGSACCQENGVRSSLDSCGEGGLGPVVDHVCSPPTTTQKASDGLQPLSCLWCTRKPSTISAGSVTAPPMAPRLTEKRQHGIQSLRRLWGGRMRYPSSISSAGSAGNSSATWESTSSAYSNATQTTLVSMDEPPGTPTIIPRWSRGDRSSSTPFKAVSPKVKNKQYPHSFHTTTTTTRGQTRPTPPPPPPPQPPPSSPTKNSHVLAGCVANDPPTTRQAKKRLTRITGIVIALIILLQGPVTVYRFVINLGFGTGWFAERGGEKLLGN